MPDGADVAGTSHHDFNADGGGVHDVTGDYAGTDVGFAGGDIVTPEQFNTVQNSISKFSERVLHNLKENIPDAKDLGVDLCFNLSSQVLKRVGLGKPFDIKEIARDAVKGAIISTLVGTAVDMGSDYDTQIAKIAAQRGETADSLKNTFFDNFISQNQNSGINETFNKAVEGLTRSISPNNCSLAHNHETMKRTIDAFLNIGEFVSDKENRLAARNLYNKLKKDK